MYNLFRDYCKAENSDDEDLQARLYAEVYYRENNLDRRDVPEKNVKDTEPVGPSENGSVRDEGIHGTGIDIKEETKDNIAGSSRSLLQDASTTEVTASNNEEHSKQSKISHVANKETCTDNSDATNANDVSLNIKREELIQANNETNNTEPSVKTELPHEQNFSESQEKETESNSVNIKTEVESPIVSPTKSLSNQVNDTTLQSHCTTQEESQPEAVNRQTILKTESITDESLLQKYDFCKSFINELYLKKYEELNKKFREQPEEIENNSLIDQVEAEDSKYNVVEKQEKSSINDEEIMVLSDSSSDSESSILEVPIPPKPEPPIISLLQDSDEDSVILSSDQESSELQTEKIEAKPESKFIDSIPFSPELQIMTPDTEDCHQTEWMKEMESCSKTSMNFSNISKEKNPSEDIVLNCTEIQKGASNINEIRESSKSVHAEKIRKDSQKNDTQSSPEKSVQAKKKSRNNQVDGNTVKELQGEASKGTKTSTLRDQTHKINTEEDIIFLDLDEIEDNTDQVASSSRNKQRTFSPKVTAERNPLDFSDDKIVEVNILPTRLRSGKKRCAEENDEEIAPAPKHIRFTDNESPDDKEKNTDEHFLRPMPENLKAFYTESRGQENFDIKEIQSRMSKDPRLWVILDEDLMPCPRKQRYWNVKCTHCHRDGHRRSDCPEPRRAPRCHMCGLPGHTESRCPHKMCLTCGKKQGTFRKTCESCRTLYCTMCNATGHKSTECPDLWRRFHQTTKNTGINIPKHLSEVMKPADMLYCCNCTRRGHDASACKEYRWSLHFPTPAFVSNYRDGPGYEDSDVLGNVAGTAQNNVPQKDSQKASKKAEKLDCGIPPESVVYSCGSSKNKDTVTKRLGGITEETATGLKEGTIVPTFLNKLLKLFKFEVKIYRENDQLMLFIRAENCLAHLLKKLILYWVKLEENEKEYGIFVDLPQEKTQCLSLLNEKHGELEQICENNPVHIWREITLMKEELKKTKENNDPVDINPYLLELQSKFVMLMNITPITTKTLTRFRKEMAKVKTDKGDVVTIERYLILLNLFNQIFVPHTPLNAQSYVRTFYKKLHKQQEKERRNLASKLRQEQTQIKLQDSGQEKIQEQTQELQKTTETKMQNSTAKAKEKSKKKNKTNENLSASIDQKKHKEIPNKQIAVHVQSTDDNTIQTKQSSDNQANVNINVQSSHGPNVSSETENVPLEDIQVSQSSLSFDSVKTNVQDTEKATPSNILLSTQQNCTTDVSMEPTLNNVTPTAVPPQTSSKKKEKTYETLEEEIRYSKTFPKYRNPKKQKPDPSTLPTRARDMVNEALKFNLPYMTKAACEVEKKLKNNTITQKHVDILHKLICLEKNRKDRIEWFYKALSK